MLTVLQEFTQKWLLSNDLKNIEPQDDGSYIPTFKSISSTNEFINGYENVLKTLNINDSEHLLLNKIFKTLYILKGFGQEHQHGTSFTR